MSFDSRLRDELREAAHAHDLREDDALHRVKATPPAEWADLGVVALEEVPRSHRRGQQVVGALAACALIAGAVALPVALRSRSRDAAPAAADQPVTTGYRSTVVIRVGEAPPASSRTNSGSQTGDRTRPDPPLTDPVRLALAWTTRNAALARSDLHSADPGIGFDARTNVTGDTLSLVVITATRAGTQALARNWASVFREARIADTKQQIRAQQHTLAQQVAAIHKRLRPIDAQLKALDPADYARVEIFDFGGAGFPGTKGPPPVPEHGTPKLLNLAFERIQILSKLTDSGEKAAQLRITVVKPDVFATVVSQSAPVYVHPPHHNSNTSTVLIAIGLLLGGVALAGSAFILGRRSRRPQPS